MRRACSTNGEINAYRLLVGKPEVKRALQMPRRSWVERRDSMGWHGVD
jgi:hypothetical protein